MKSKFVNFNRSWQRKSRLLWDVKAIILSTFTHLHLYQVGLMVPAQITHGHTCTLTQHTHIYTHPWPTHNHTHVHTHAFKYTHIHVLTPHVSTHIYIHIAKSVCYHTSIYSVTLSHTHSYKTHCSMPSYATFATCCSPVHR